MPNSDINYDEVLASGPSGDLAAMAQFLREELPHVWRDAYLAMPPGRHNIHRIETDGFEYLWDLSGELVQQGAIMPNEAAEDRLIAAYGVSRRNAEKRDDSRLRPRTLGAVDVIDPAERSSYDRGHAIGHALGGALDLNIIPQYRPMNRGGEWRRMERYCNEHPGTYFFCRPIYIGLCAHPIEIEFGVLKDIASLWLNRFQNYGALAEVHAFERLYAEKIRATESA